MAKGFKTGGRTKGTPNKATADVRALAQQYTAEAIAELYRLATEAESEAARVAAIKELLDRGHGKATQAVEMTGKDGGPVESRETVEIAGPAAAAIAERLMRLAK